MSLTCDNLNFTSVDMVTMRAWHDPPTHQPTNPPSTIHHHPPFSFRVAATGARLHNPQPKTANANAKHAAAQDTQDLHGFGRGPEIHGRASSVRVSLTVRTLNPSSLVIRIFGNRKIYINISSYLNCLLILKAKTRELGVIFKIFKGGAPSHFF